MVPSLTRTRESLEPPPRRSGPRTVVRDEDGALAFPRPSQADDLHCSAQFTARFDPDQRALWFQWTPAPRPCFNLELLVDLKRFTDRLVGSDGRFAHQETHYPIDYSVMTSATPGVFNMGGDLDLFARLIQARDRAGLVAYGRACIDVLYQNLMGFGHDITTIALVQGECLGGGFEAALSNEVIIAEAGSRFGFPEILFNMFPGMGAYSMLVRRVGRRIADQLICGGERHSAHEVLAMGVIDAVVPPGEGEAGVHECIRKRQRNRNGLAGIATVRRLAQPLPYDELLAVVHVWADRALRLGERDLRLMQRLVAKQAS